MPKNKILLIFFIILTLTSSGYCLEGKELIGDAGYIDWINMKIIAIGEGIPPNNALTPIQAQIMAKRAAVVVARRNLLEVVKGVYIDSTTKVENLILQNDSINSKIQGILQGAIVDDIQCQKEICKAQVSMPLQGELAQTLLKTPPPNFFQEKNKALLARLENLEVRIQRLELFLAKLEEKQTPSTTSSEEEDNEQLTKLQQELLKQIQKQLELEKKITSLESKLVKLEQTSKTQEKTSYPSLNLPAYTSLIVDARGINFRPSLKPELILEQQVIYPASYVDINTAVKKGYVRYFNDLNKAQKSELAGNLPYLIKAIDIYAGKKSSLLLSSESKEYLLNILNTPDNFLKECKVIIVF